MALDRRTADLVRRLDEHELRQLVILARGRLEALAAAGAQTDGRFDNGDGPSVRYRQQLRRCGKPNCTQCPHGPYWYAVWRDGSRVKTRYVGRELPS